MKRFKFAGFMAMVFMAISGAAHAQPTFPTVAWDDGVEAILTNLGTIVNTIWPALALLVALFLGVRVVMNLPRRAAK